MAGLVSCPRNRRMTNSHHAKSILEADVLASSLNRPLALRLKWADGIAAYDQAGQYRAVVLPRDQEKHEGRRAEGYTGNKRQRHRGRYAFRVRASRGKGRFSEA
jgi:hypothetical protein